MPDKKKSTRKTSDTSTSHKASQKQKIKPPKRNKSAFILFSQDRRPQLKQELNLNSNEMMVELGNLWRGSDPEVKEEYERRAADDKDRYTKELEEFTQKYPAKLVHNKTKKNHVKKACSAYAVFLKETLEAVRQENPDLKMADLLKIFSQKWKEMPEEQKKKYQKKAQKEQDSVKKQKSGKKGAQKPQRRGRKPKLVKREEDTPSPSIIIKEEEEEEETLYRSFEEEEEASVQKRVKIGDSVPVLMELESIDNYFLSPTTETDESYQLKIDFDSLMTSPLQIENLDVLCLEKDDFMFAEARKPALEIESKLFDLHTFDFQQTSMIFKNTEELPFLNNMGSLFRSRCFSDKMEVQAQSKPNVYNQLITDLLPQDQESLILPMLM